MDRVAHAADAGTGHLKHAMKRFDVVIAGGAAIGSAAAYFLTAHPAFRGCSVLVLEPDPTYSQCATTRSVASIRHQFSTAGNIRMSQFGTGFVRSAAQLLAVDGQVPDLGFREAGYLFLASVSGLAQLRHNHEVQRSCGADVAWLDAAQLQARFPWLSTDDIAGAVLGLSGEGWIDAHSLLAALRRRAIAQGAIYQVRRAVGLTRSGSKIVSVGLDDGSSVACATVINAAGVGATRLALSAGIDLPVEPRKRSVFFFRTPAALPDCPLVIDPSGVYFRPEGDGFLAGVAPPAHEDLPSTDFDVQHHLFESHIWPTLAQRVPGLAALRLGSAWAGHYDMNTFDHNLVIGAHPEVDNLLFANGLSGHGLQQAPAIGRALAELTVSARFETLDLSEFGWERILAGRPLRELNVV